MAQPKIVKKDEGQFLSRLKDKITIKLTGDDTNGLYALMEQNNEVGMKVTPHTHGNEDEVFKLIEGTVKFKLGNEEIILGKGDAVFCPRGIEHTWEVIGNENAKVSLSVFPAGIEQMFIQLDKMVSDGIHIDEMQALFKKYNLKMDITHHD